MTEYICEPIRDFEWDSGYECGYIRKGELIRCKDCRFYSNFLGANPHYHLCERFDAYRKADEFCSRAERKEE